MKKTDNEFAPSLIFGPMLLGDPGVYPDPGKTNESPSEPEPEGDDDLGNVRVLMMP